MLKLLVTIKFMDTRDAMTVGAIHGRANEVRTNVCCEFFFIAITPIIRRHRQHIVADVVEVVFAVAAIVDCTVK